ncbi:DUF190 domain-containing protein [uncultured Sunxiuqinia sp.]|uniref:DUF190 domain-containing protein n=1 Tax=uncultured Sunxiuqinia sp. TaxID=1573825 RepID=UPI002AA60993|nr:DUF190 domain-containing protein [uncultured Sunxiuqinia sp.]
MGASYSIHEIKIFALSSHLPIVVEIVDEKSKIGVFSKQVSELIGDSKKGALVTIQDVDVVEYKSGENIVSLKSPRMAYVYW